MTGKLFVGGEKKRNFATTLLANGLAKIDPRDLEFSDAELVSAMEAAKLTKLKIWSLVSETDKVEVAKPTNGVPEEVKTVRLTDVTNGNKFYVNLDREASSKVASAMAEFKEVNGVNPGPVEFKKNKLIAALFDDGSGPAWYRAKVIEKKANGGAKILYVDHGNVSAVTPKDCRILDGNLEAIPYAATECELALTKARDLEHDEGVEAARMLSSLCWGKDLTARIHGKDVNGGTGLAVTLYDPSEPKSINAQLVKAGLARIIRERDCQFFAKETQVEGVKELYKGLIDEQDEAKKARLGIWRYGDVGEDDDPFA